MLNIMPFLKLIRAPAGFTAISNILATSVIVSNGQLDWSLLYLLSASVCFYFSGMTLNDCFDYKEDLAERAFRPLPSGQISIGFAWLFGFGLMIAGLGMAFAFSQASGVIGMFLCLAIVLYNGVIKDGLLGSFCMASCRYVNWIFGASFVLMFATSKQSLSQNLSSIDYFIAVPIFFYIAGLTYLSKQETSAANKQAVWVTAFFIFCSAISSLFLAHMHFELFDWQRYIAYGIVILWSLLMLNKLRVVFADFVPENIQKLIGFMVIGVIPLDALITAMAGHYLYSLFILALLPPCRMLNKKLYVT
ncbi:hypothetical protein GCM10007852_27000 [Agaribacter marinus]|uniref:4-hydroxybenzoate polyprenyltransferase n=2 Tax=Agaribacter marinus TaxID=1431249 RepID=A0AA37WJ91_9ALTE|nr:hypothetical protein GCM10007852_27000 [Agaribacter marinus]